MSDKLVITENPKEDQYPEDIEFRSLTESSIDTEEDIRIGEKKISEWNQIYVEVNLKAFSFLRVLAEILQMKEISSNLNATSLLTAKKPYLFQMLTEKELEVPKTVTVSSPKGVNNITEEFEGEILAKKYSNLQLVEKEQIEPDEIESFSDSTDHFEDFLVFQEPQEECFEVLYLFGDTIALKQGEESKYQVMPDEEREVVEEISERLGIDIFQARVGNGKILDVKPNIELEKFREKSGKNVYGKLISGLGDGS